MTKPRVTDLNARARPTDDCVPDVRDGLTRVERVVLAVLAETQRELAGRSVPLPMLYGRVLARIDLSREELMDVVRRLTGRGPARPPR